MMKLYCAAIRKRLQTRFMIWGSGRGQWEWPVFKQVLNYPVDTLKSCSEGGAAMAPGCSC